MRRPGRPRGAAWPSGSSPLARQPDDHARDDARADAGPVERALQDVADHHGERPLEGVAPVLRIRERVGHEQSAWLGERSHLGGHVLGLERGAEKVHHVLQLGERGLGSGPVTAARCRSAWRCRLGGSPGGERAPYTAALVGDALQPRALGRPERRRGRELERRGRGDEAVRKGDQRALLPVASPQRRVNDPDAPEQREHPGHPRRHQGRERRRRLGLARRRPELACQGVFCRLYSRPQLLSEEFRGVAGGDEQVDGDRGRDGKREDRPEPETCPDHQLRIWHGVRHGHGTCRRGRR